MTERAPPQNILREKKTRRGKRFGDRNSKLKITSKEGAVPIKVE